MAAGAVLLGAGAYFGKQARDKTDEWQAAERNGAAYPGGVADIESAGQRAETLEIVSFVVGGVALATGVVLLVLDGASPLAGPVAAAPSGVRVAF